MVVANYTSLLLTARELSDIRLQKKGLTGNSFQVTENNDGFNSATGQPLVNKRVKTLRDEDEEYDFMMSYFEKLRGQNLEVKEAVKKASYKPDLGEGSSTGAMTDPGGDPVDILNQGDDVNITPPVSGETFFNLKHPKKAAELKKDEVFMSRLSDMRGRYPGLTEDEVFKVIDGESAFNPKAESSADAVGLFQMMPKVLGELGFTSKEVLAMSPTNQLNVYEEYLERWDYDGSYGLGILQAAPSKRNSPPETIIYKKGSAEWKQNKGWRSANNGDITKRSIEAYYGRTE